MVSSKKIKYDYQKKFNPKNLKSDSVDRLSTSFVPRNSKILELGCATGFMSQYFRKVLGCQIIGVDIDSQSKPTIVGDLDKKSTWKQIKAKKPYDLVFASAVIEHLKEPEIILQSIKQVLKPQGDLIITTPNVAHWRTRWNLLLGKWNYTDYGILDRTHLKFFTYNTFQQLIKNAGFKIKAIKLDPAGGIKYFNFIAKYFPNFYAHQVVIYAKKN